MSCTTLCNLHGLKDVSGLDTTRGLELRGSKTAPPTGMCCVSHAFLAFCVDEVHVLEPQLVVNMETHEMTDIVGQDTKVGSEWGAQDTLNRKSSSSRSVSPGLDGTQRSGRVRPINLD